MKRKKQSAEYTQIRHPGNAALAVFQNSFRSSRLGEVQAGV